MKGDFTRNTFNPKKHYRDVLIQQGRVQVDADWNEQAELTARRDETTTADIVGDCGGPADDAAFGVFTQASAPAAQPSGQPPAQTLRVPRQLPPASPSGDFFLTAGRYYVDGIQCENEKAVLYTLQPDRFDLAPLGVNKSFLLYLDVWHRHLTALEDGQIREPALGGPDHGTRLKTIWQVRALDLGPGGVIQGNPCGSGANLFHDLADPGTAKLTARTATQQAPKDPCLVPPSAGYTGLENQLYRVEIHDPGSALNAAGNMSGTGTVTLPSGNAPKNKITVTGGTWAVGNIVEIYPSQTSSPKMKGQLARITAVNGSSLTLNIPVTGFVAADAPKLRKITGATWKWSRENGSVVTRIERINGSKITVSSLGPDKNLGFAKDAWVEILDDALELESKPGQLAQIDDVDEATRIITLKSVASSLVPAGFPPANYPNGVVPQRHPKLRRWEDIAAVKFVADPNTNWLPLESGIQVRFANGSYRTGHYWQIPARAATAQSPAGDIEWPGDNATRLALAPRGITHHFCRLGIVTVQADGSINWTDCRCLWPALTAVPRLFYVSGDGQEVMPDLTDATGKRYKLPQPLIVGLGNGQCAPPGTTVRFSVIHSAAFPGDGRVAVVNAAPAAQSVDVPLGADGMARCDFHLDRNHYSQQVRAQLLDAAGVPCSLPIIFNATLSIASQVAYNPDGCGALQGQKTVQDAIARLASLARLEAVGGDGQDVEPGAVLAKPIQVLVTSACGPVAGAKVRFDTGGNQGIVTDINGGFPGPILDVTTVADGLAACHWKPSADPLLATQELTATLILPNNTVLKQPGTLRFTANLRLGHGGCCVTVGKDGEFATLQTAITTLIGRDVQEICICLLPGDHEVVELVVTGIAHLNIHGCGRASRILVKNLFEAYQLRSITLQDLCIYVDNAKNRPIYINSCADVTITGCHVKNQDTGNRRPTDLLTIGHATKPVPPRRVHVANNLIECQGTMSLIDIDPGFTAPDVTFTAGSPTVVETALSNLAGKSKSQRATFVKKFRKIVKETPKSDPKKGLLEAALKRVAAPPRSTKKSKAARSIEGPSEAATTIAVPLATTPEDLAAAVIGPPPPTTFPIFGPALVIADAEAELMVVNNIIKGEVRFYGMQQRFDLDGFRHFASRIQGDNITWAPTPNDAKIEGNSLTEITVDEKLDDVFQNPQATLSGIFNRLSLLNNTFASSFPQNEWLAANVISNGNHFMPGADILGIAAGLSFMCIVTSADNTRALLRYAARSGRVQVGSSLISFEPL